MSTLGTFAEYADFGLLDSLDQARQRMEPGYADKVVRKSKAKRIANNPVIQGMNPDRVQKTRYQGRRATVVTQGSGAITRPTAETKSAMKVTKQSEKSKKAVANSFAEIAKKKRLKMRNLGVGIGLGTAGLAGLGAAAYLNRDSGRRAEMGYESAFANFQATQMELPLGLPSSKSGKKRDLTADELAGIKKRSKKPDSVMSADDIKATQERLKKYGGQRAAERNIDKGGDIYKGAKGMDYVTRTGALLGSPERQAIAAGKASKNEIVQNIAKGAEGFGRLGYKTGAIGGRGVLNKVVGRTATGKVARLGAAGVGLAAIGGAMKRNRQERG
jgi:hypothetical protein